MSSFKAVGVATSSILTIQFTSSSGSTFRVNADSAPTLVIQKAGVTVATITNPTNTELGIYTAPWTPATSGQYDLVWTFTVNSVEYTATDVVFAFDHASNVDVPDAPDVGSSNTCLITGTFIDAAGDYLQGVYVRFSPSIESARKMGIGFVAADVTAVSNASGQVSFNVVRGIQGLLAISGTALVRNVTVPNQANIDLFDLAATGSDLLEVQELELIPLPRRS
jgi:hypothetical protein